MSNQNKILIAFVFIVALFSINFFQAKFALDNNIKYLRAGVLGIAISLSLPFFFIKSRGLTLYIQVIVISILISMYMAHYSWAQSYIDSVKITIPVVMWCFYFFLLRFRINIEWIEKIALFYGVLFIIFYGFQYLNAQTVYFGYSEEFKADRGIIRIMFSGGGFFTLATFIALNKYTDGPTNKQFWLALLVVGVIITIMQVTRQNIAAVLTVCLYHLLKKLSFIKKAAIGGLFLFSILITLNSDNAFINKLFNQTHHDDTVSGNIRFREAEFLLNNHYRDQINKVLGNGLPYGEGTKYGLYQIMLVKKSFYYTDVGLVSFYIFFGIFAIVALLILYFKCLTIKVPKNYMYLKYYIFYLIVTALASDSCFNYNYLITNVFVFYGLQYFYISKKDSIRIRFTTTTIDINKQPTV
jgi:hypothetical protein